ncbi:hypothetical protein PLICRDRAFT_173024 [Plicaturopsis crispa FD-325 SS-3]|nr:hypothetical protein PLICRDRAFT_173024 [Plicaturopsis crispa FD-325 SS-3]
MRSGDEDVERGRRCAAVCLNFWKAPPLAHNVIKHDTSFAHADAPPGSRRPTVTVDVPLLRSLLRHTVAVPRSVQDAGMPTNKRLGHDPCDRTRRVLRTWHGC